MPRDTPSNWEDELMHGREGIKSNFRNVMLILRNRAEWHQVLGFCDFSYRRIKLKITPTAGAKGEWTGVDTLELKDWLGLHYDISPSNNDIEDAVLLYSKDNSFHPIQDYLNSLEWDGTSRLDYWLKNTLGAAGDDSYLSAVGRKFLIGAVARVMSAPCKMDNVLILEGNQGKGKSALVRELFGKDWYSESSLDIGNKDAFQHIQGIWGVELPELDSFNKAESTTLKSFFTVLKDRFRPPYGRNMEEFPRQCVFIGTTNQDEYLKDYSGNRRYWPVRCDSIDLSEVIRDRDQLWAEALHLFKAGEHWWVNADTDEAEVFREHQDQRMLDDPWESMISGWLQGTNQIVEPYFTSAQILIGGCGRDPGHIQRSDQNRISPLMKHLGWVSTRKRITIDGVVKQSRVYVRPGRNPETF